MARTLRGQNAFDKLVRPAALCRCEGAENRKLEEIEETELNGVEERQNEMSDKGGDRSVAEMCNVEVATEAAVKGDQPSNGLIENAAMLPRGIIRTIKCHIESSTQEVLREDTPVMPWRQTSG